MKLGITCGIASEHVGRYYSGYVVAGSNGEAPYLRPEERVELVRQVRTTVDKSQSVIGGATHECKCRYDYVLVNLKVKDAPLWYSSPQCH